MPSPSLGRREFLAAALALPALSCAARRRGGAHGSAIDRLGASTACLAGHGLIDAIERIRRMGFGTIELIAYTGARHSVGAIPGFALQEATPRERELVFEATRPFLHVSAHLPFQDVRLLAADRATRDAGVARLRAALDGLAFLRGELAVLHVGRPEGGARFRDVWPLLVNTLRALGDDAGERGIRVGIETMQPDSARDYTELVLAVDHPRVGATIDTGHVRGSTDIALPPDRRDSEDARARFNDVLDAIVASLGRKVFHFHLSDVRREDWADHRAIGTGIVDFRRLFATMRRVGYDGLLVLELEERDQVAALRASQAYVAGLIGSGRR